MPRTTKGICLSRIGLTLILNEHFEGNNGKMWNLKL